jgi:hypothetical protein
MVPHKLIGRFEYHSGVHGHRAVAIGEDGVEVDLLDLRRPLDKI